MRVVSAMESVGLLNIFDFPFDYRFALFTTGNGYSRSIAALPGVRNVAQTRPEMRVRGREYHFEMRSVYRGGSRKPHVSQRETPAQCRPGIDPVSTIVARIAATIAALASLS